MRLASFLVVRVRRSIAESQNSNLKTSRRLPHAPLPAATMHRKMGCAPAASRAESCEGGFVYPVAASLRKCFPDHPGSNGARVEAERETAGTVSVLALSGPGASHALRRAPNTDAFRHPGTGVIVYSLAGWPVNRKLLSVLPECRRWPTWRVGVRWHAKLRLPTRSRFPRPVV